MRRIPDPHEAAIRRGDPITNEPAEFCTLCGEEIDALEEVERTSEGWPLHADAADCAYPDDDDSGYEWRCDMAREND